MKKPRRPFSEVEAGDKFRNTLLPRADGRDGHVPYFYGWAIMDAFLAGIDHAKKTSLVGAAQRLMKSRRLTDRAVLAFMGLVSKPPRKPRKVFKHPASGRTVKTCRCGNCERCRWRKKQARKRKGKKR